MTMAIIILPEELIVEILLLLPVAALLRFRCVSKKWRNLIDSPGFVKSHLDHTNKAHSSVILLGQPNAYQIHVDSICNSTAPHTLLKELSPNPCLGIGSYNHGVVGPCNGLLCIKTVFGIFVCGIRLWESIVMFHYLPLQSTEFLMCSWGFGYDCDSDDYKVVCVVCSEVRSDTFGVWVYSLKSGYWVNIGDFPYFFVGSGIGGVFVNGALHWIVSDSSLPIYKYNIVAFGLGKLKYNLVPQPESMPNPMVQMKMEMRVGVLDGFFYAMYEDRGDTNAFDLWVMKEYGVKDSWTRLIKCTSSRPCTLTPLAYTEAGDLLLWFSAVFTAAGVSRGLMHYEFETRSFKRMEESFNEELSPLLPDLHRAFVYIPSLVCPQIAWNSSGVVIQETGAAVA